MKNKKVCVLILNYNGKPLLEECLSSYMNNNYPNFEVVLIDNGSSDGSLEYVKESFRQVTLIENRANLGYSAGFNQGLIYAFEKNDFDYAVISNNDVKADSGLLKELVKVADSDPDIGFVTGKVYFYDNPQMLQTVGFIPDNLRWVAGQLGHKEMDTGQYDTILEREFTDDIFILVAKRCYEVTHGYDIEFTFQAEQFDWQIRAKKAGFKIYYTPFAKLWHKDSITIGKTSPFKAYYDVRNSLVVRLKHRERAFVKKYFKWYLANIFFAPFIRNLIKLKVKMAFRILRGFLSALLWGFRNRKIDKLI